MRRYLRPIAAAAAATTMVVGAAAPSAFASTHHKAKGPLTLHIAGDGSLTAGPLPIGHVDFSAKRVGTVPTKGVSGNFVGEIETFAKEEVRGPITCLDVSGPDISFLYPVDQAGSTNAHGVAALKITIVRGTTTKLGFMPEPTALAKTCGPASAPLTYHGPLVVRYSR